MNLHNADYSQFANDHLGGISPAALARFFYWNDPFVLKHWTMNAAECLFIGGGLLGLYHAFRVFKQQRDPGNLSIWCAAVLYFLVMEPPLYFPDLLGVNLPIYFAHNEFSAGLMYGRAPLYIVFLYPALIYPCYVLVRQAGIFAQFGRWKGAICVGFLHSILYEIFDHFGPQYGWWAWNFNEPTIGLRLASVPLSSILLFSLFPPLAFALLAQVFLNPPCSQPARSAGFWISRTVLVGVLVPTVVAIPDLVFAACVMLGATFLAMLYCYATVILVAVMALYVFAAAVGKAGHVAAGDRFTTLYPALFILIYLIAFALLWLYASSELVIAAGGVTERGTPVGSLPYVIVCFIAASYVLLCGFRFVGGTRYSQLAAGSP